MRPELVRSVPNNGTLHASLPHLDSYTGNPVKIAACNRIR